MRVLLITKNLPPDVGGMETLWFEAIRELAKKCTLTVVGPAPATEILAPICDFIPSPKPLYLFFPMAFLKAMTQASKKNYDVILAGSGVTAPIALLSAKISNARSYVYLHGLDIIYPNILYRLGFTSTFKYFDKVICNSRNTAALVKQKNVGDERIQVVNPAASNWAHEAPSPIKECVIDPTKENIVFLGRLVERKGLIPFIQRSLLQLCRDRERLHLHIIGSAASEHAKQYSAHLHQLLAQEGLEERITFHGSLPQSLANDLVSKCLLHVLPAIDVKGDVEGYGMTIIETATLGIPTVAFNLGGIRDAIERTQKGILVNAGNYQGFNQAIAQILDSPQQKTGESLLKVPYSWNDFADQTLQMLDT